MMVQESPSGGDECALKDKHYPRLKWVENESVASDGDTLLLERETHQTEMSLLTVFRARFGRMKSLRVVARPPSRQGPAFLKRDRETRRLQGAGL